MSGAAQAMRPPHDSFWVDPGRLLAGPYPGAPDRAGTVTVLSALMDAGVRVFVDLTEAGERTASGPMRPYAADLTRMPGGQEATHLRFPIRDVSVPAPELMHRILGTLRDVADAPGAAYVHCWGGVGRTGTVIGCLLRERGRSSDDALADLARLRAGTDRARRTAPETPQQRDFVRGWIPRPPGS